MNQDQSLRRLLDELHSADAMRQAVPRDTPAYAEAADRVDRLVKAVWDTAGTELPAAPLRDGRRDQDEGMDL